MDRQKEGMTYLVRLERAKNESPISSVMKAMAKVKVFQKYVKLQGHGHKMKNNGTM